MSFVREGRTAESLDDFRYGQTLIFNLDNALERRRSRFFEHLFANVNRQRRSERHRHRDRVAWPRIDRDHFAILFAKV